MKKELPNSFMYLFLSHQTHASVPVEVHSAVEPAMSEAGRLAIGADPPSHDLNFAGHLFQVASPARWESGTSLEVQRTNSCRILTSPTREGATIERNAAGTPTPTCVKRSDYN